MEAWARESRDKTTKAYREGTDDGQGGVSLGAVTEGSVVATLEYDGAGRRIVNAVTNSGPLDCTYHDYYTTDWQLIETRNGSDQTIKHHVWGLTYIDELIEVGLNNDHTLDNTIDTHYWACTSVNYNVMGIVDSGGTLVERYEYDPYGARRVYISAGSNDPACMAPTAMSRRWAVVSAEQPWGKCDVGHQGLIAEAGGFGLLMNRARVYSPKMARFVQRDPLGYVDGMSVYCRGALVNRVDPTGERMCCVKELRLHHWGPTIDPGRGRMFYRFRVTGEFGDEGAADSTCCKVLQWVNGTVTQLRPSHGPGHASPFHPAYTRVGIDTTRGGTPLDGQWHLDTDPYHNDDPAGQANMGISIHFGTMAFDDHPGFFEEGSVLQGDRINVKIRLAIGVYDKCRGHSLVAGTPDYGFRARGLFADQLAFTPTGQFYDDVTDQGYRPELGSRIWPRY